MPTFGFSPFERQDIADEGAVRRGFAVAPHWCRRAPRIPPSGPRFELLGDLCLRWPGLGARARHRIGRTRPAIPSSPPEAPLELPTAPSNDSPTAPSIGA